MLSNLTVNVYRVRTCVYKKPGGACTVDLAKPIFVGLILPVLIPSSPDMGSITNICRPFSGRNSGFLEELDISHFTHQHAQYSVVPVAQVKANLRKPLDTSSLRKRIHSVSSGQREKKKGHLTQKEVP